jgi:hypothetical protein
MKPIKFVQVGDYSPRDTDGSFLPSAPIYMREEDAGRINPSTGRPIGEDMALQKFAKGLTQIKEDTA